MHDKITSVQLLDACNKYWDGKIRRMFDDLDAETIMSETTWYALLQNRRFVKSYDPEDHGLVLAERIGDWLIARGHTDPDWVNSDSAARTSDYFCRLVRAYTGADCSFSAGSFTITKGESRIVL